jgi:hypothetical protein
MPYKLVKNRPVEPSQRERAISDFLAKGLEAYCLKAIQEKRNQGNSATQEISFRARDLVIQTNGETSEDAHKRLIDALDKLSGTSVDKTESRSAAADVEGYEFDGTLPSC